MKFPFISADPAIAETQPPAPTFYAGIKDTSGCWVTTPSSGLDPQRVHEFVSDFLGDDLGDGFELVIGEEGVS